MTSDELKKLLKEHLFIEIYRSYFDDDRLRIELVWKEDPNDPNDDFVICSCLE